MLTESQDYVRLGQLKGAARAAMGTAFLCDSADLGYHLLHVSSLLSWSHVHVDMRVGLGLAIGSTASAVLAELLARGRSQPTHTAD